MATGLIVNVGADTTDFKDEIRELPREFEKAEQEITQSADRVGGAIDGALKGLISAGTVVALERVINHFDKVADAASKYGETAEDIQRVGTAAELTGGNIDSVAMAMERAGVAAAKAARGNEEFVEKFNRAGIDAAAFSAATLTERVKMVAAAQQAAGTSGDRHAAILEALGESVAGIDFQRIADEMGNVIVASNETVTQLSRANDLIHQAKGTAMVFAAEGLGAIANYFEKIGNILGEGESGVLAQLGRFNKLALQLTPFSATLNLLGLGGKTNKELEEAEKRLNAIALLRSRDGIDNATEEQIKAEMSAMVERERQATSAAAETTKAIDEGKAKTEQSAQIKQRLLEISLLLKEAEAANNSELVDQLKHSEDIYKGILKYKDAEDAYGMAVRDANAELEKRQRLDPQKNLQTIETNYKREISRIENLPVRLSEQSKARVILDAQYLQAKRNAYRGIVDTVDPSNNNSRRTGELSFDGRTYLDTSAKPEDAATETTLQKVASLMEQLNTKLPQPVLV